MPRRPQKKGLVEFLDNRHISEHKGRVVPSNTFNLMFGEAGEKKIKKEGSQASLNIQDIGWHVLFS